MGQVERTEEVAPKVSRHTTGDLIATASHELRQPLASIRGFVQMLLGHWADLSDDDRREMLEEILHDSERVLDLVDELLDASRVETGRLQLAPRSTDLAQMARNVVAKLKRLYPALEPEIGLSELPAVMVDPSKMERVFFNLLANACQHAQAQGVRISGERAGGEVIITIYDRGPGISTQDLPHVTEKFWRTDDGQLSGLGLGLWISEQIVGAHGGRLSIGPGPGQGVAVRFTIPVHDELQAGKLKG
jgi:signal transduction histidine kinase